MSEFIENKTSYIENNPEQTAKQQHKKLFVIGISAGILILIALVYFFFTFLYPQITSKTYTDSLHYFSITVPKEWSTDQEEGNNTTGLNTTHPVTQKIEITQLSVSSQEGIAVQVDEGAPVCPIQKPNTMFAGFPAYYDSFIKSWTIPTTKATIVVSISYPGSTLKQFPSASTTAPSQTEIIKGQNDVMGILKTLKLTNLKPFSCR